MENFEIPKGRVGQARFGKVLKWSHIGCVFISMFEIACQENYLGRPGKRMSISRRSRPTTAKLT